ncbi:2-polyprenyl-3-methyl-5-hydroxy-6-metoxy-1,4-benzoquinol methylase [Stackebrandtia endophytica]|uniref:2-polyprenyl-3-methyl-5-hydroxy-6-metoxy-1, 4-benzoquinol methylase n=1 Tax=Stackebrandtia endophytica TaxID=1496996 RepID=A0A543AVS2_9ACTN|nr:class I SAM-dependent methyltransferase [Stackebrandtia endophytica]TQL76678.1 2-polyprenyl-3-methyl-5-hydroxy-6-metoxy-1,4-benzoquinol methylase [Stackebrandtia endophytica]
MTKEWTNEAAIRQWNSTASRAALAATADEGDFAKRHLVNEHVFRLLGNVAGQRILDAGCGNGYLSRMLADRGATVVGVEPTDAMVSFARDHEADEPRGVEYIQADLSRPSDLGGFDAVVCSMVLMAVPDWKPAMRTCVAAAKPGGTFVFTLVHPAFEQLAAGWREHGRYRVDRYLEEYELVGPAASDFHRPLSAYLNEVAALGCRIREVVEPGLAPDIVESRPELEYLSRLPNFLLVAVETPPSRHP